MTGTHSPLSPFSSSPGKDKSQASKSNPKGLARIKAVRKIVDAIIKRSRLEITELHIFHPDANGVCAKGRIKLSHLGTGPLPLVGLQIKFKDEDGVALRWSQDGEADKKSGVRAEAYVRAHIDPIQLQQGAPGSAQSEVGLRIFVDDDMRPSFVAFVKRVLQADPKTGVTMRLQAVGVQVKAYGLRFGGLSLDKEVLLGGLGSLNGALEFEDATSHTQTTQSTVKPERNSARLEISNLDIVGGEADKGIEVVSHVTIVNPAQKPKLVVEPGQLRFALCVYDEAILHAKDAPKYLPRGYVQLGSITLAATVLTPGRNTVRATGYLLLPKQALEAQGSFAACAHAAGQTFIARILQNERAKVSAIATPYDVAVSGSGVSDVGWLAAAFEGARIEAQIPPLGDRVRLLDGAEVRVEERKDNRYNTSMRSAMDPTTSPSLPMQGAVARATLRNSFGTDFLVHSLRVKACSNPLVDEQGRTDILELGTLTSSEGDWNGLMLSQGQATHVSLPMEINPDPKVLIELLRKSAATKDVDLGHPFTQLLEELRSSHWTDAGFDKPTQSRPASTHDGTSRTSSSHDGNHPSSTLRRSRDKLERHSTEQRADEPANDLAEMLAKALANLRVTAHVEAVISIGQFDLPGTLRFEQRDLPIALSTATAASLLPLVGQPFVKALVDRAEVEFCAVELKHLHDRGIDADLALRLTNFGPLSAQVNFEEGLHLKEMIDDGSPGRTLAVIHFTEPLAVIAGDDDPVMIGATIVPPSGREGMSYFRQFVNNVLVHEDTTYHAVTDRISVVSGGVQFQTVFAKNITVDGLGGLADLRLDNLEIFGDATAPVSGVSISVAAPSRSGGPDAIEIRARTQITNRGNLHLRLQKLEVTLSYEGVDIGQASIDNVDVQPYRTSSMPVRGLLYASSEAKTNLSEEKFSRLIDRLFCGDEVTVEVQGRRGWVHPLRKSADETSPDAQAPARRSSDVSVSLAWFDEALRDFSTTAALQWNDGVQLIKQVEVGHINAIFPARKPVQLKIDSVTAQYQVPFPIAFTILDVSAEIEVLYKKHVIANCQAFQNSIEQVEDTEQAAGRRRSSVARNVSPALMSPAREAIDASSKGASGKLHLSLKPFDLLMQDDSDGLFGNMLADVFQAGPEETAQMMLRGTASVKAKTALGVLDIRVPLGIEKKLELQGLDGLRQKPLQYDSLEISGATSSYVELSLNAHSHNPSSSLTIHIPDSSLSLATYYDEAFVGDVVIGGKAQGVTLAPGAIFLPHCAFRYHPTVASEPAGHQMLSDLFEGRSVHLSIRGHKRSSVSPALAQALASLNLPITVAPLSSGDIIERIQVTLGLNVVTSNSIDARYFLDNPTKLDIDILRLEVNTFYQSQPFGSAVKTYSKEGRELLNIRRDTIGPEQTSGAQSPGKATRGTEDQTSQRSFQGRGHQSDLERLRIPPGAKGFEGAIVVKPQQPLDQLVKAFLHERGSIVLDVEIVAKLDINGFELPRFVYRQRGVPLEIAGLKGVARILRLV